MVKIAWNYQTIDLLVIKNNLSKFQMFGQYKFKSDYKIGQIFYISFKCFQNL